MASSIAAALCAGSTVRLRNVLTLHPVYEPTRFYRDNLGKRWIRHGPRTVYRLRLSERLPLPGMDKQVVTTKDGLPVRRLLR